MQWSPSGLVSVTRQALVSVTRAADALEGLRFDFYRIREDLKELLELQRKIVDLMAIVTDEPLD